MLVLQRDWDPAILSFGVGGRGRQHTHSVLRHLPPDSSSRRGRQQLSSSSSSTYRNCRQSTDHRLRSQRGPPSTSMDRLLRTLTSLKDVAWGQGQGQSGSVRSDDDDDWTDRLSRRYMSTTFAVLSVAVTTKQLVGEPISCWCPAFFEESHRIYTNSICWISSTFYVPFDVRIPAEIDEEWKSRQIVCYYQWVPIILLTLSLLTLLPTIMWRFLSQRSGIDVASLMTSAASAQSAGYAELRDRTMRYCVNQIDRYLLSQRDRRNNCCTRHLETVAKHCLLFGGKRHGNYLTVSYLVVKFAYLVNAVGQLFLLEYLLGFNYSLYGLHATWSVLHSGKWHFNETFPRVTLCAFQIRHQSRVHDYVVQCALSINLFNEKIFAVVWFFLAGIAVVTAVSLVHWSARVMYWPAQIRFVRRRLRDFDAPGMYSSAIANNRHAKTTLAKFVECYLRRDGLLIIRLMALNVGELAAAETLAGLWENYGPDKRLLGALHAQSTGRASCGGSDSTDRGLEQTVMKRRRQVNTTATTSGTVVVDNSMSHAGCRTTTSRELV